MGIIDLLTVKETADLLKTSRQQIRKMICSGLIPAVRIGHGLHIDRIYLREFLDQPYQTACRGWEEKQVYFTGKIPYLS